MKNTRKQQQGFTIVELLIVLALVGLMAVLATPGIRGLMMQIRVEPTANDLNKVVTKIRGNYAGSGPTPYAGMTTAIFANSARGLASSFTISAATGSGATIQHDVGLTGSQVAVAPAQITTAGDSFTVTMPTVNNSACPSLASILNRSSEIISINGTNVKDATLSTPVLYNAGSAQNACTADDTNTFVFTFR